MAQPAAAHAADAPAVDQSRAQPPASGPETDGGQQTPTSPGWVVLGIVIVFGLAWLVTSLTTHLPTWTKGTWFGSVSKSIEFPVYAIILGFLFNWILSALGIRDKTAPAYRTELYIKIGLVLLGSTVNINIILAAAIPSILQALLIISTVFFFTWWFAGKLGIGPHLRALLS